MVRMVDGGRGRGEAGTRRVGRQVGGGWEEGAWWLTTKMTGMIISVKSSH